MKKVFSIVIHHDYDKSDSETLGISNDLIIVPAAATSVLVKKNGLLFRSQNALLDCFMEEGMTIKNETAILFFWVVCKGEGFYSYTAYPDNSIFSSPFYYWSNSVVKTTLSENDYCDLHPGSPPKQAIGCIGILLKDLDGTEKLEFTIAFKTRETFWEYHLIRKDSGANLGRPAASGNAFQIIDTYFKQDKVAVPWEFTQTPESTLTEIIFRSKVPLPFLKKATNRLKLVWSQVPPNPQQKDQEMLLPFPNYEFKRFNKNNEEMTPVYIYI